MSRGLTEQQWRDLASRWTEMRPEHLDWRVHVEIRALGSIDVRAPWEVAMNVRVETVRPARHVAYVELTGSTLSGLSFGMDDDVPPQRTIATWEVEHTLLAELYEPLIEMFTDERLMQQVEVRAPMWESSVQEWVWQRFCERGRG